MASVDRTVSTQMAKSICQTSRDYFSRGAESLLGGSPARNHGASLVSFKAIWGAPSRHDTGYGNLCYGNADSAYIMGAAKLGPKAGFVFYYGEEVLPGNPIEKK